MTDAEKRMTRDAAKRNMRILREKRTEQKQTLIRQTDRDRKRIARLKKKTNTVLKETSTLLDADQNFFSSYMDTLEWKVCEICHKKDFKSPYDRKQCSDCASFTADNDMDPGDLPVELQNLSFIEQLLIARIHPIVSLYKLRRGQFKYTGQVINFPQNVQEVYTSLPQKITDLTGVVTVRVDRSDGFKDFHVHKEKVLNALLWLKNYNPFYHDIQISYDNLDELPSDDNIYRLTKGVDVTNEDLSHDTNTEGNGLEGTHWFSNDTDMMEESNEDEETIEYKDVPNVINFSQKERIENKILSDVLLFPSIGAVPINEFSNPGYITMAFPHLFPYGTADYSNRQSNSVHLSKYIKHLMLYKDGRFAKDPRFRFFLLNSQMRWQALNLGNVFVKKNEMFSHMSVLQLKQHLESNPNVISQIMFYSSRLRSTNAYWRSRCSELLDLVSQLGPPTIFFTISCADFHWKNLWRLLGYSDPSQLTSQDKARIITENPLIVSNFFKVRSDVFLKKCFFKHFKVKDYWYRIEYQNRGSPHIHGVAWLPDAPDVRNLSTDEDKEKARLYFDNLITCINPDISFMPSLVHPCSKSLSDVVNLDEDLIELINHVQRHTKCSKFYCLKFDKKTKTVKCRFGFPKDLLSETTITEINGILDILFARNDALLNKFIAWLLQTWRSNVDASPIFSDYAVSRYIAKYSAKCEVKSNELDSLISDIINTHNDDNDHCKRIVKRLLVSTCAERDYSAQEVMHLLMGYELFHCSRSFVVINLKKPMWEKVSESKTVTFVTHYTNRPPHLEKLNLINCARKYYVSKNRWVERKQEAIVRVFPRIKHSFNLDIEEVRLTCMFNLPWRNSSDFNEPIEELIHRLKIVDIDLECDDDFTLEWSHDEDSTVESDSETEETPHDNENNDDWKLLSRMTGKKKKDSTKTVNKKAVEQMNFKWDYAHDKYDIDVLLNSVKEVKSFRKSKPVEPVDYSSLNEDQMKVFSHFCSLVKGFKKKKVWVKERLIVVQGKAGYGKSYLLKAMKYYCYQNFGDGSFAVVAPSGVAAKNVDGETIHSYLRIPRKVAYFRPMNDDDLRLFQESKKDLKFLFIDEYSMVGCRLLGIINQRCKEAKDDSSLFGNLCIFLMGDIYQLTGIGDKALFSNHFPPGTGRLVQDGKLAIDSFQKTFFLNTPMRFTDQFYVEFLSRLSEGNCTDVDLKLVKERAITRMETVDQQNFKQALRICSTKDDVQDYNRDKLVELNNPIARISAQNNCQEAFDSKLEDAGGLPNTLYLAVGARVMLRFNINVSMGLVNGSLGYIHDIIYQKGCSPPSLPKFILIQFDDCNGFSELDSCIPITPMHAHWYEKKINCVRFQFPIELSWSCTIHKSQSLTLNVCQIDLGDVEFVIGLTYVAFSRVRNLNSLLLLKNITLDRLNSVKRSQQYISRENFINFLEQLL